MRRLCTVLIGVSLLPWAAALASAAAPKVVWSEEAEKFATPGGMRFGAAVADDPAASGGKAVRIPCQSGSNGWSMVFSPPTHGDARAGPVHLLAPCRGPPATDAGIHADAGRPRQADRAMGLPPRNPRLRRQPPDAGLHPGHPGPRRALDRRDLRPGSDPPVGRASQGRRAGHVSGQGRDLGPGSRRSTRAGGFAREDSLPARGGGDGAHVAGQPHRRSDRRNAGGRGDPRRRYAPGSLPGERHPRRRRSRSR